MSVAIIDYGSGNLHSAAKAFERATRASENPQKVVVTRDPETVFRADRIVLPGVGAFADCRRGVDALDGCGDGVGLLFGSAAQQATATHQVGPHALARPQQGVAHCLQ